MGLPSPSRFCWTITSSCERRASFRRLRRRICRCRSLHRLLFVWIRHRRIAGIRRVQGGAINAGSCSMAYPALRLEIGFGSAWESSGAMACAPFSAASAAEPVGWPRLRDWLGRCHRVHRRAESVSPASVARASACAISVFPLPHGPSQASCCHHRELAAVPAYRESRTRRQSELICPSLLTQAATPRTKRRKGIVDRLTRPAFESRR